MTDYAMVIIDSALKRLNSTRESYIVDLATYSKSVCVTEESLKVLEANIIELELAKEKLSG